MEQLTTVHRIDGFRRGRILDQAGNDQTGELFVGVSRRAELAELHGDLPIRPALDGPLEKPEPAGGGSRLYC